MNAANMGRVEGLMVCLLIAERNKKHPQRIQPEILKILENLSVDIGQMSIQTINFDAKYARAN